MPRIQGVDIPPDKPTHISLRYIRGLGPTTSLEVCEKLQHRPAAAGEGTDRRRDRSHRRALLDRDYLVEGPLRRQEAGEHRPAQGNQCYRGERHRKNLPCRGQRTKTNARTRKGVRKTVAGKKGVKDLR